MSERDRFVPNPQGLTHSDECPMNEDGVECTCRLEARIAETHPAGCSCVLCDEHLENP